MKPDTPSFEEDVLDADRLPPVPKDREEVAERARQVTRRVAEGNRAECIAGLLEIAERGRQHPGELGDLGPDPVECGALATQLKKVNAFLVHLAALTTYGEALRAVIEEKAVRRLDDGHEQVVMRTKRALIPDEAYTNVRRFGSAHGEAVSQGIARAAKLRAEVEKAARKSPPANDTNDKPRTGTGDA